MFGVIFNIFSKYNVIFGFLGLVLVLFEGKVVLVIGVGMYYLFLLRVKFWSFCICIVVLLSIFFVCGMGYLF